MTAAPHAPSFLEIAEPDDAVFVINSFSKPWAMTGWRIGWLVHPAILAEPMRVMAPGQQHRRHALSCNMARWRRCRRKAMNSAETCWRAAANGREVVEDFIDRQNRIRWMKPDGAFYGFLHVDGLKDSLAFAQELVRSAKVGVAPGSAFGLGDPRDDAYVRICFAQDARDELARRAWPHRERADARSTIALTVTHDACLNRFHRRPRPGSRRWCCAGSR